MKQYIETETVKSLIFIIAYKRYLSQSILEDYSELTGVNDVYFFKATIANALLNSDIRYIQELDDIITARIDKFKNKLLDRLIEVVKHYNDRSIYKKYVRCLSNAYARIDNLNLSSGV